MKQTPRIAAVGLASWDTLLVVDEYPAPGGYAIVNQLASLPGGTTTNSAMALARIGARVSFAGMIGDDAHGAAIATALDQAGIDTGWLAVRTGEPTDAAIIVVSSRPSDRTIFWPQGAHLLRGDALDVPAIFGHDLVLLDVDDMPLRRFLTDLPAHTLPATRLLGTMTYVAGMGFDDAFDVMLRHDAIVGNEREAIAIAGVETLDEAIARFQRDMIGANLRAVVISRGAEGGVVATARERWDQPAFPVEVRDTTGAGDAFTAGIAWGMALRWPWPKTLTFANALGGLAIRQLGAQASLPTLDEIADLTGQPVAYWKP